MKECGFYFSEIINDEVWFEVHNKLYDFCLIKQPHLEITLQLNNSKNTVIWSYAIRRRGDKYIVNGKGSRNKSSQELAITIAKEIEQKWGVKIP